MDAQQSVNIEKPRKPETSLREPNNAYL